MQQKLFGKPDDWWLQIGGLTTAVVTLIVTVILSLRSENVKELTITYLPKHPLMSMEAGEANVGLEVRRGDVRIKAPWLVSGKIENTGNQPIEERDIEAPARIRFDGGRIVGVEILQSSQEGLASKASIEGNDVVFSHKLLNPGDWIGFDVIFDGEPTTPPTALSRISGIPQLKQRILLSGDTRRLLALVPLAAPVIYCLLTIGSIGALISIGAGVALVAVSGRLYLFRRQSYNEQAESRRERADSVFSSTNVLERLGTSSPNANALYEVTRRHFALRDLDDVVSVRAVICGHVPGTLLSALQLSTDEAASLLKKELRDSLRQFIYYAFYEFIPSSAERRDTSYEELMADTDRLSAAELLERAKDVAARPGDRVKVHKSDLLLASFCLGFGISLVLILGGTWRAVLTSWI
jgi:hypothetical protein